MLNAINIGEAKIVRATHKNKHIPELLLELANMIMLGHDNKKHNDPMINTLLRILSRRLHLLRPYLVNKLFKAVAVTIITQHLVDALGIEYYYDKDRAHAMIQEGKMLSTMVNDGNQINKEHFDRVLAELKLIEHAEKDNGSVEIIPTTNQELRMAVDSAMRKALLYLGMLCTVFNPLKLTINHNDTSVLLAVVSLLRLKHSHIFIQRASYLYAHLSNVSLKTPHIVVLDDYSPSKIDAACIVHALFMILPKDSIIFVASSYKTYPINEKSLSSYGDIIKDCHAVYRSRTASQYLARKFSRGEINREYDQPVLWIQTGISDSSLNVINITDKPANTQSFTIPASTPDYAKAITAIIKEAIWHEQQEQ